MNFKEFMKRILGIKRRSTVVNSNQQQSTVEGFYNLRDLQYARRMGQIEQMAADLALIKEKITGLDIKFDLRIPDKVLTEKKFEEEVSSNEDFFIELEKIREGVEELKKIIGCQQLSTTINSCQQQSTVRYFGKNKKIC